MVDRELNSYLIGGAVTLSAAVPFELVFSSLMRNYGFWGACGVVIIPIVMLTFIFLAPVPRETTSKYYFCIMFFACVIIGVLIEAILYCVGYTVVHIFGFTG